MQKLKNITNSVDEKYRGKWLLFEEIEYLNKNGELKKWECVNRTTERGAVIIVAKINGSDKVILVRQYRAPLNSYVIEFPAGLVDKEEDISVTAQRELLEETGYVGEVVYISHPNYSSPGMTNEFVYTVFMNVDLSKNRNPNQKCEESESIEVVILSINDVLSFLDERIKSGDKVDSKLYSFMLGLNFKS